MTKQLTPEERRQLEELYRQQVSAVRTLAKLLGYECPIRTREEKRVQSVDNRGILTAIEKP